MFGKKKLYRIKYRLYAYHETIVSARNPVQALKKVKKEYCDYLDIISIEEYN